MSMYVGYYYGAAELFQVKSTQYLPGKVQQLPYDQWIGHFIRQRDTPFFEGGDQSWYIGIRTPVNPNMPTVKPFHCGLAMKQTTTVQKGRKKKVAERPAIIYFTGEVEEHGRT